MGVIVQVAVVLLLSLPDAHLLTRNRPQLERGHGPTTGQQSLVEYSTFLFEEFSLSYSTSRDELEREGYSGHLHHA